MIEINISNPSIYYTPLPASPKLPTELKGPGSQGFNLLFLKFFIFTLAPYFRGDFAELLAYFVRKGPKSQIENY